MTPMIALHIVAAVSALCLGTVVLASPKGTPRHKLMGRIWVTLMVFVAVGSFSIRSLDHAGGLSWIHLLSVLTLISLVYAIIMIRRGNRRAHFSAMLGSFIGILVAGIFTLNPGRIIGSFFFGS